MQLTKKKYNPTREVKYEDKSTILDTWQMTIRSLYCFISGRARVHTFSCSYPCCGKPGSNYQEPEFLPPVVPSIRYNVKVPPDFNIIRYIRV